MSSQQRPPTRTFSSTALSSSSSMPSSPGPSVSIRGLTRSNTPTAMDVSSFPARSRPGPFQRTTSGNSSSYTSNAGASTSRGIGRPGHGRDRSTSNFSVGTSASARPTNHNRRQPTLLGGNVNSKLSRSHLATYNSTAMERNNSSSSGLNVPDILINGAERPEDVDIGSIGRLPSLSAASPVRSSPEATSIGVDGLFAKFGVKEVRSIAQRGKAKAEAKRGELRTMVGERYRDLLGAADSIVRMRRSSGVLLDRLSRARQECDRETMLSRAAEEDMTRSHALSRSATPLVSGHTPYSVATLVKLLLDCPEHIWRCIERQDYLSAARLDSIGRAVYRELVSAGKQRAVAGHKRSFRDDRNEDDGNDSGGYDSDNEENDETGLLAAFPLVEQQFDTLNQLAPQISSRATLHLRTWDVPASAVSESLATILMLDKTSVSDALKELLQQRTKTLASLLQHHSTSAPLSRAGSRQLASTVQSSLPPAGPGTSNSHDALSRTLEALALTIATHEHALQCFSASGDSRNPLLPHLLRLLQQNPSYSGNSSLPDTPPLLTRSRSDTAASQPVTLPPVLSSLPNAHLFMRYLPEQILSFTPYIAIDSGDDIANLESVSTELSSWFEKALHTLKEGAIRLFQSHNSASELANSRSAIQVFLAHKTSSTSVSLTTQIDALGNLLDGVLADRFSQIYSSKLDATAALVPKTLQDAIRSLPNSPQDLDSIDFLFSSTLPFPSTSVFSLTTGSSSSTAVSERGVGSDPFTALVKAMQDRVAGRSPVLSSCLQKFEIAATDLQEDVLAWLGEGSSEEGKIQYTSAARQTISRIEAVLAENLRKEEDVTSQLFIGSVAAYLALDSSFVQSLLLMSPGEVLPEEDRVALLGLETASTEQWRDRTVHKTTSLLKSSLTELLALPGPDSQARPVGPVHANLGLLVHAINQVGVYRTVARPHFVRTLLQDYEKAVLAIVFDQEFILQVANLQHSQRASHAHAIIASMSYIRLVISMGLDRSEDAVPTEWHLLEERLAEATPTMKSSQDADRVNLLRTQNLLAPLLSTSYRYSNVLTTDFSDDSSPLLPFGTPSPANASEVKLDLAKPGPRLALLPINATAA